MTRKAGTNQTRWLDMSERLNKTMIRRFSIRYRRIKVWYGSTIYTVYARDSS